MADFMSRVREIGRLFWRSAKETGETAAELIEQRTQIQRLSGHIRRLEKERQELLRQIGVKVYALHGQGKVRNQDVLADCQRIDAILGEISQLKKQIEQIRSAGLAKGLELPDLADETPLTEEMEPTKETKAAEEAPALQDERLKASEESLEVQESAEARKESLASAPEPAAAEEGGSPGETAKSPAARGEEPENRD